MPSSMAFFFGGGGGGGGAAPRNANVSNEVFLVVDAIRKAYKNKACVCLVLVFAVCKPLVLLTFIRVVRIRTSCAVLIRAKGRFCVGCRE